MAQQCEGNINDNTMTDWIDTNAITRITTKTHRIRWKIENVSTVAIKERLTGPDFHLSPVLLMCVVFKKTDHHLCLYVCNKSDFEIQIERKIYLFNCNNEKLHEDKDIKLFILDKDGEEVDMLGNVDRKRFDNLPNDTLIIDLSLSMRGDITTIICPLNKAVNPKKKLIGDLKAMLESSVNSDVSLQIGEEQIPAHWSILCSRSSYFKKMFDSDMLERKQNSIVITDLSVGTLKKLLKFLYTADFTDTHDENLVELFDLYIAADKYEIMDMRSICSGIIMSQATADNICQIFQLAHHHFDASLKMQAMNFIRSNSDEVFQMDGWKKFEASEPLAAELLSFCLKQNKFTC